MKQIITFIFFASILVFSSCRKDFSTKLSTGNLTFSKDTVFLDTVFSQIGSSTYTLKVYNKSNTDISIPTISLADNDASGYRLNVDGTPGKYFENIPILAKDSIFIFIETTIDYNQVTDPLYEDQILFDSGENQQDVKLITLVQDAHFLYPNKINEVVETLVVDGEETNIRGRYLTDEELTFTNDKPYVIYGYMMVGTEQNDPKTLTIEAGANVHFHANSGLYVNQNASLHINGAQNIEGQEQTEIILQGDRLEPLYEDVPGQWGNIVLLPNSIDNHINYATIKNGTIGLISQGLQSIATPVLEIKNTQIYNNSLFGILGIHTNIKASNLVINNSGISDFSAMVGGAYNFTHCTFANSWRTGRSTANIWLLDHNEVIKREEDELVTADFYELNFTNCIISGSANIELELEQKGDTNFDYNFNNNIIQFDDHNNTYTGIAFYDFTDSNHYNNNILNGEPDFKDPYTNDLIIGEESEANAQANAAGTSLVPLDIMGVSRSNPADLGAYEHVVFEE